MRRAAWTLFLLLCGFGAASASLSVEVDEPAVCFVCHGDVSKQLGLAHRHTAFEGGECSSCHNPHASGHAALLSTSVTGLCLGCHDDYSPLVSSLDVHGPVARGECTSCHDPHASANVAQLHAETAAQCATCHEEVTGWSAATQVHAPVEEGDCSACHDPHGLSSESLLRNSVQETCFECHSADAAFFASHRSRAIASSNCATCHDPHASGRNALLRTNQHAPFASGSCETCHGEMGPSSSFEVTGVTDLCTRCHKQTESFADYTFRHNLDAEGSCVQCHNAHASNGKALLASDTRSLCMGCHFGEPDRKKARAEYMTHDGVDCTACHTPHGGENPQYFVAELRESCGGCHDGAHRTSHPVGEDVLDPRTGMPVDCLSCHQLHGADFEKYLPLDPTRELCIQCHRR